MDSRDRFGHTVFRRSGDSPEFGRIGGPPELSELSVRRNPSEVVGGLCFDERVTAIEFDFGAGYFQTQVVS